MRVEFYKHSLGFEEMQCLEKILKNIFLTTGPQTQKFEEQLAAYLGCKQAVGLSSCTEALFLCLKALNIGPGHEVITSPMTFIATANAIVQAGAKPVFVDVEKHTGNIDASRIEEAITPRTRAIIPVHLYGNMADMNALQAIAHSYNLYIIEDAAHCLEGERDGVRPGQLSAAACFSFYATKSITCGEGGAVVTNSPALAEQLKSLRSHGMSKEAVHRHAYYEHWDMPSFGYKANLDDVRAALLLPQMPKIETRRLQREKICRSYSQGLADIENLLLPQSTPNSKQAWHLFTIWVSRESRDSCLHFLQQQGIGVAVNYRPVHLMQYYARTFGFEPGSLPIAEDIGARTISLPLYPALTEAEQGYVIQTVNKMSAADYRL